MSVAVEFCENILDEVTADFTNVRLSEVVSNFVDELFEFFDIIAPFIWEYFVILFAFYLFFKFFADWKEGIFCAATLKEDFFYESLTLILCFLTMFYCSALLIVVLIKQCPFKVFAVVVCVFVPLLLISTEVYVVPILQNAQRLGAKTEKCEQLLKKFLKKLDDRI